MCIQIIASSPWPVARGWCIVDYSCKSLPAPHVLRVVRCWGAICDFPGKLDGHFFRHVNAMLRINAMTTPPRDDLHARRRGLLALTGHVLQGLAKERTRRRRVPMSDSADGAVVGERTDVLRT